MALEGMEGYGWTVCWKVLMRDDGLGRDSGIGGTEGDYYVEAEKEKQEARRFNTGRGTTRANGGTFVFEAAAFE